MPEHHDQAGTADRAPDSTRRGFLSATAIAAAAGLSACGSQSSESESTPQPAPQSIGQYPIDLGPTRRIRSDTWLAVNAKLPVPRSEQLTVGATVPVLLYVRRPSEGDSEDKGPFRVLTGRCSHLGCPVRWVGAADRFICPCHGGIFDDNGIPIAGPPERPLTYARNIVRDGRLYSQLPPNDVPRSVLGHS